MCASAQRTGAQYLIGEDPQDGRILGGLKIVNPFDPANDPLIDNILPR